MGKAAMALLFVTFESLIAWTQGNAQTKSVGQTVPPIAEDSAISKGKASALMLGWLST